MMIEDIIAWLLLGYGEAFAFAYSLEIMKFILEKGGGISAFILSVIFYGLCLSILDWIPENLSPESWFKNVISEIRKYSFEAPSNLLGTISCYIIRIFVSLVILIGSMAIFSKISTDPLFLLFAISVSGLLAYLGSNICLVGEGVVYGRY